MEITELTKTNNTMRVIHIIKEISCIPCRELAGVRTFGPSMAILPGFVEFTKINIFGHAKLEVNDSFEDKIRKYETQLTFRSACFKHEADEPMAYLATSPEGESWLIGMQHPPYPVATFSEIHPDEPAASSLTTFKIVWKSDHRAVKIAN